MMMIHSIAHRVLPLQKGVVVPKIYATPSTSNATKQAAAAAAAAVCGAGGNYVYGYHPFHVISCVLCTVVFRRE